MNDDRAHLLDTRPRLELALCVAGPANARLRTEFEECVSKLAAMRTWTLGPPTLMVDEDPSRPKRLRQTIFMRMELFSGYNNLPPLPLDVDRAQFEEASLVIEQLRLFSQQYSCVIYCFYAGEQIGSINLGTATDLYQGFLGPWRESLDARK